MRTRLFLPAIVLLFASAAYPCSTFCVKANGEVVFGRNYDFEIGDGVVHVNQRGVEKRALLRKNAAQAAWTSRFGSITFNQFGKEMPMDGMNEAGLVVALMWLDGTQYPPADSRPPLGVLEWIQYQLDSHATVAEVIASTATTRISGSTPIHYLIADAHGVSATIEYLAGELVVHTGPSLTSANLTNDSYASSLNYLRQFRGFGGTLSAPASSSSLDRFARTAIMMTQITATRPASDQAFEILESVAQPGATRWSVVYNATRKQVEWRTPVSSSVKTLSFSQLDLSCNAGPKSLDVSLAAAGNVTSRLDNFDTAANLAFMIRTYGTTSFLRNTPREEIVALAAHATSFRCASGGRRRTVRK